MQGLCDLSLTKECSVRVTSLFHSPGAAEKERSQPQGDFPQGREVGRIDPWPGLKQAIGIPRSTLISVWTYDFESGFLP